MHKLVLYCKSYRGDINRIDILINSINKYNMDNIPVYVSCPSQDYELFLQKQWTNVTIIVDEDIDSTTGGWHGQQIIKSQFWKLNICENYVCIDSDSEFIRPFFIRDFMYNDEVPYTIMHEDKELLEWCQRANLGFDVQQSSEDDRNKVMSVFNRTGIYYDFGPSPVIWSTKVWKSLFENYIYPNNLSFADLIAYSSSEFTWYGEWLLSNNIIPIYPRQPLFKVFHYQGQYIESKQKGYQIDDFKKLYMGVILQSNWNAPLTY